LVDLSDNLVTDQGLLHTERFLRDGGEIRDLKLSKTHLADRGLARFFAAIGETRRPWPRRVWLTFDSRSTCDELTEHACFVEIAKCLRSGYPLKKLHLTGPITANDGIAIVSVLSGNLDLRVIDFESDFTERYANPDPVIAPDAEKRFTVLVAKL
jgi:hypothetical protein